jgi:hypothetical protein
MKRREFITLLGGWWRDDVAAIVKLAKVVNLVPTN